MSIKTVLTEATEAELAEAVQGNLFVLFEMMARVLTEAEIVLSPSSISTRSRILVWLNQPPKLY